MKVASHKSIGRQLDTAWSQLVKLLWNNKCAYCNGVIDLHAHHVRTRKKKSTRWDADNGILLCGDHHVYNTFFSAHGTPEKFLRWMDQDKGKDWMVGLLIKSNKTSKLMIFEKQELLEELQTQIINLKTQ